MLLVVQLNPLRHHALHLEAHLEGQSVSPASAEHASRPPAQLTLVCSDSSSSSISRVTLSTSFSSGLLKAFWAAVTSHLWMYACLPPHETAFQTVEPTSQAVCTTPSPTRTTQAHITKPIHGSCRPGSDSEHGTWTRLKPPNWLSVEYVSQLLCR